jgi:hypothetical protein
MQKILKRKVIRHVSPSKKRQKDTKEDEQLIPPTRPDPFEPTLSYYHQNLGLPPNTLPVGYKCKTCVRTQSCFPFAEDHVVEYVKTNNKFNKRDDTLCMRMDRMVPRRNISTGYPLTASRFAATQHSSFLGGDVTQLETNPRKSRYTEKRRNTS